MIPATHPAVRALAEAMAAEHHTALVAAMARIDGAVSFSLTVPPALVAAQAALLVDLTRTASRDLWMRWLFDHFIEHGGPIRSTSLRDKPEELEAAVRAALAVLS